MPTLHEAARYYASTGIHVFPVEPRGKNPHHMLGREGGHKHATVDAATIDAWWQADPTANIGISLAPSGLVVLDVDVGTRKDGTPKRGHEMLRALDAEIDLPATRWAHTGGGGLHFVYARPEDTHAGRKPGFRENLDLLALGYILAAPSIHPNGTPYTWADASAPIAPLPAPLRAVLGAPRAASERVATTTSELPALTEGGRTLALYRMGAALRNMGTGEGGITAALTEANATRCNPPLNNYRLGRCIDSAMRADITRDVAGGAVIEQAVTSLFAKPGTATIAEAFTGVHTPAPVATDVDGRPPRMARLARVIARDELPAVRTYPTPIPELNALLGGGAKTRQLAVMGAPPGNGKSAFITTMARHYEGQLPQLWFCTELDQQEMLARLAAPILGKPWRDLVAGEVPWSEVQRAVADLNIYCVGTDQMPRSGNDALALLVQCIREIHEDTGVTPFVYVDYIQHLARGGEDDQQRTRVADITNKLRQISQVCDCPVWAICTVSRGYYGTNSDSLEDIEDAVRFMGMAKESGEVEYDAATIVFIDLRKRIEGCDHRLGRLAVAKSRHGEPGFASVKFFGATGHWAEAPGETLPTTADAKAATTANAHERCKAEILKIVDDQTGRCTPGTYDALMTQTALSNLSDQNPKYAVSAIKALQREGRLVAYARGGKPPVIGLPAGKATTTPSARDPLIGALMGIAPGVPPPWLAAPS